LFVAAALAALAQSKPGRIWDGVFTAAQAERGKAAYAASCTNCHNADLAGSVRAPALRGERFLATWQDGSVSRLFRKIRDSMPATYPETVPEEVKIDIIAYLLQSNSFPAGAAELKLDEQELEDIQIVKKGDRTVPSFALVQVVGCLEKSSGRAWMLTKASEPSVTREDQASASSIQLSAAQPLGTGAFILVSASAFKPEMHSGQKMEARGLLYRDPGGNRLNLTSLQPLGAACSN
jgi:mono/diheme cytochrome c family protein